jgi:solute carrier family 27 fatty acid transporter 1/4
MANYNFQIPGCEGKAGMAAIVDPEHKLDMENLANGIRSSLPAYARPVFIRVLPELPLTGTFKLIKRDLQAQGYNMDKVKEPIYFQQGNGSYKLMTEKDFEDVKSGRARL